MRERHIEGKAMKNHAERDVDQVKEYQQPVKAGKRKRPKVF